MIEVVTNLLGEVVSVYNTYGGSSTWCFSGTVRAVYLADHYPHLLVEVIRSYDHQPGDLACVRYDYERMVSTTRHPYDVLMALGRINPDGTTAP